MNSSVAVKVYLMGDGKNDSEIHRFSLETVNNTAEFNALKERIFSLFPQIRSTNGKIQISYKDDEGDMISISTDEELNLALATPTKDTLFRLYIGRPVTRCGRRRLDDDGASDVHVGVTCDGCENAIRGYRYKCVVCPDYDLCACCEIKKVHPQHLMLRIPTPTHSPWSGMMMGGGRCPFGRGRFQKCSDKWRNAARHGGPQTQEESRGTCTGENQANPQFPFQKLFEDAANHFNAFVKNNSAGPSNGASDNKNADNDPQSQEAKGTCTGDNQANPQFAFQKLFEDAANHFNTFVNNSAGPSNDVSDNKNAENNVPPFNNPNEILKNVGEAVFNILDTIGVNANVQAENMWGQREQCGENCDKDPKNTEDNVGDEEMQSENEPLLNKSDAETSEGWTYVNDKDKQSSAEAAAPQKNNSHIQNTLDQMLSMGFTNEGGWLNQLLEIKNGNIDAVLEVLTPIKPKN